ncbi:M6 family metalloprotease domain-containing protein [Marinifilum fragile]|uniref:T9SS type A sorting domain-containing protein n=1 Tax=Marinifilum fragile TaxID=570161 RepID=UPI002AABAD1A|nr:M6 family metalloprotease domain-containing protein [Marinifilum fragile]
MKGIITTLFFALVVFSGISAPFKFLKTTGTLPDGTKIELYSSGDEFYNWLHDKEGYTILKAADGYYYYAIKNSDEELIASSVRYGKGNANELGIPKWLKISKGEYKTRRENLFVISKVKGANISPKNAPRTGELNNIVIYIRFNDDDKFDISRQDYDRKFNSFYEYSLRGYYNEVSYGKLDIISTHYPKLSDNSNNSYKDGHNRGYFQQYNETTAPGGFKTDDERRSREHNLLKDAINSVKSKIESDFTPEQLDADLDGQIDNICFVVRGNSEGWSSLLWAHRWALYSIDVRIHGKRVYDYVFQPENQVEPTTLCHEMFHTLGAPDLYHYEDSGIDPAGGWDLMQSGRGHMLSYMKWKYSGQNWIEEIPEIKESGRYTLKPLSNSENNCYMIKSPNSEEEYFVIEYRKKDDNTYDKFIPGSGLIVYRVNPNINGNADGPPDEVYVYRPDGNLTVNGDLNKAFFSKDAGRVSIHNTSSPTPFLSDGSFGGLIISDISEATETISFTYGYIDVKPVENFLGEPIDDKSISLSWKMNAENNFVMVAVSEDNVFGVPENNVSYKVDEEIPGGGTVINASNFNVGIIHEGLEAGKTYYYSAWSYDGESYSERKFCNVTTDCTINKVDDYVIDFENITNLYANCWRIKKNFKQDGLNGKNLKEVDSDSWFIGSSNSFVGSGDLVYEGTNSLMIRSSSAGFNWAISPKFTINVGELNPTLQFMINYQNGNLEGEYRNTNFYVLVKESGNWNELLNWSENKNMNNETIKSNAFEEEVKISLLDFVGKTIEIGFVYEQNNGFDLALDNIVLKNLYGTSIPLAIENIDIVSLKVFPNPVLNKMEMQFSNGQKKQISIYDINGKLVHSSNIFKANLTLDLSSYNKGIYLLVVTENNYKIMRKIIKI